MGSVISFFLHVPVDNESWHRHWLRFSFFCVSQIVNACAISLFSTCELKFKIAEKGYIKKPVLVGCACGI